MASWNVGPSRLNNGVDNGLLDLKALLNQAIGGGLGSSLGGGGGTLNTAVGSGSRSGGIGSSSSGVGGLPRIGGNGGNGGGSSGGSAFGGGILDGTVYGNGGGSGGGGGGASNGSSFFDPFASMSTFGFFNPKDPSSNMPGPHSQPASGQGMGGSGGGGSGSSMGNHLNSVGGGMGSQMGGGMMRNGQSKSPTGYNSHNSHSPAFAPSHSPTFFGGGNSGNHQSNHYSGSSSNFSSSSSSKFPISTFSIDDTLSVRYTVFTISDFTMHKPT